MRTRTVCPRVQAINSMQLATGFHMPENVFLSIIDKTLAKTCWTLFNIKIFFFPFYNYNKKTLNGEKKEREEIQSF